MAVDLKKVPSTPGVYKFFNKTEIIYIGKAKNLKKRVSSYFGNSYKDRKTSQIKFLTDKVETFTTKNEVEALLLEQTLIKENKPDILICGHSHILKVVRDTTNDLLFINPGACGKVGFHKKKTILRFDILENKIDGLEVIELS